MCVDRTARTNLPSARGSRASVARQNRAAVLGETVDWTSVFLAFMAVNFNRLKITQGANQFYPETHSKCYRENRPNLAARGIVLDDSEPAQASPDSGRVSMGGSWS